MHNGDVIVIGAGSVGANVAYRLADRGARVTVFEAGAPGGGTSGMSFAWTTRSTKRRATTTISTRRHGRAPGAREELGGGDWHRRTARSPGKRSLLRGPGSRRRSNGSRAGAIPWRSSPRTTHAARARSSHRAPRGRGGLHAERGIRGGRAAHRQAPRPCPAPGRAGVARRACDRVNREGGRVRGVTTAEREPLRGRRGGRLRGTGDGRGRAARRHRDPLRSRPRRLIYTTPVASTLRRPIHAPGVHFRPDGAGRIVLAEGAHDHVWRRSRPGARLAGRAVAPRRVRTLSRAGRRPRRGDPRRRAADAEGRAPDGRRHSRPRRVLRRRLSQRGDARAAVGPHRRGGAPRRRRRPAPGALSTREISPMTRPDVLIVGGGVMGCAVAYSSPGRPARPCSSATGSARAPRGRTPR